MRRLLLCLLAAAVEVTTETEQKQSRPFSFSKYITKSDIEANSREVLRDLTGSLLCMALTALSVFCDGETVAFVAPFCNRPRRFAFRHVVAHKEMLLIKN